MSNNLNFSSKDIKDLSNLINDQLYITYRNYPHSNIDDVINIILEQCYTIIVELDDDDYYSKYLYEQAEIKSKRFCEFIDKYVREHYDDYPFEDDYSFDDEEEY